MAIQIPGPVENLPRPYRHVVENRDSEYLRSNPAGERQAVAVVNAKDVIRPDDLNHPGATCLIKMSEVSIEGLRQAFLDPDSRIRLNSDLQPEEHGRAAGPILGRRVSRRHRRALESESQCSCGRARRWQVHGHREPTLRVGARPYRRGGDQGSPGNRAAGAPKRYQDLAASTLRSPVAP